MRILDDQLDSATDNYCQDDEMTSLLPEEWVFEFQDKNGPTV